jgi:CTD small phosphatase-like protein 2
LDPENKVSKRIFRESCVTVGDSYFIKNLEVIDRDLKDIVLIDNASYSFA